MRKIKPREIYPAILAVFFIQMALGCFFGFTSVRPNLMIIITTFFALFTDRRSGFASGAASGLLLDIFSIRTFGINTVLFAVTGYVVGRYNTKFYRASVITHVIITFAVSLSILSLYFLFVNLRASFGLSPIGAGRVFHTSVVASSLLNAFLGPWIYAFLCRLFGLSEHEL